MKTALIILTGLAMVGVLGVLFAGLIGFVGGAHDPRRSNKLMQYRVLLQGIALALFAMVLWMSK